MIAEAASEKVKRGRPPVFGPTSRAFIGDLFPDVKTYRGQSDLLYRQRAFNLLSKDGRFAWIADGVKAEAGSPGAWRPSILVELGRIPKSETMKAVAMRVCELKPKTKDAVAMIRRFRLGREPKGDYLQLLTQLEAALNTYLTAHPSAPTDWPVNALRDLAEFIEQNRVAT